MDYAAESGHCYHNPVQDLYDQKGDNKRERLTIPLMMGDDIARVSIAFPVAFWSFLCSVFWHLDFRGFALPIALGSVVIYRLYRHRDLSADKVSFKIWSF